MSQQKLPIGIQTFRKIREGGFTYVDKTVEAKALAQQAGVYFLSRPRRFGKSLFVDTLKELFEGNEALFHGLHIHDQWDWSQRHPVILLDFAAGVVQNRAELDRRIRQLIKDNALRLGIDGDGQDNDIPGCFADLIRQAHGQSGQRAVVLIDEYDKPILDNIEHPERAAELREGLKNLYSALKAEDAHLRFVFLTGVSKFSRVSLFSGLNQLRDITLSAPFATICGYTQQDLETTFAEHLAGVDWDELRRWYNGYGFLGEPVYNPYDILLFISDGHSFRNYWFETGSPSFLIKLFQQRRYFLPDLEQLEVGEEILDSFDVERINPVTLLFQAGYLTVASTTQQWGELTFRLRIPNSEVRRALNNQFIDAYAGISDTRLSYKRGLIEALAQADLPALVATIKRLFASIPWRNFTGNDLPDAEGYYASVLYAFFASLDAEIIPEDLTNHGQVDLTLKLAGYIYVIEIKLLRDARGKDDRDLGPNAVTAASVTAPATAPATVPATVATATSEDSPALLGNPASAAPAFGTGTGTGTGAERTAKGPAAPATNPALAQIQARGYSQKYQQAPGKGLFEVGLVFSSAARNLIQADWRRLR
ncbi:ATP-binding protein [Halochromatium salexigens]|uniref:ATP-binding protein n=1 Tax=Halochromatium salexigens TaxID=49447 RepID=UPI001F5D2174|nr:ATP-binding protein [Halochromatium salexigens]